MGFSTNIIITTPIHDGEIHLEDYGLDEGPSGDADANAALHHYWQSYLADRGNGTLIYPAGEFASRTWNYHRGITVKGKGNGKGNNSIGGVTDGTKIFTVEVEPMILHNDESERGVTGQYFDIEFHGNSIATNIFQANTPLLYMEWQRVTMHNPITRSHPSYSQGNNGIVFKCKGLESSELTGLFLWGGEIIYKNELYSGGYTAAANNVHFRGGNMGEPGKHLIHNTGGGLLTLTSVNIEPFECDDSVIYISDVAAGSGYKRGIKLLNCWGEIGLEGNTTFLELDGGNHVIDFCEFAVCNVEHFGHLTGNSARLSVRDTNPQGLGAEAWNIAAGCIVDTYNSATTNTGAGTLNTIA